VYSVAGSTTLIFPPRVLCCRQHHSHFSSPCTLLTAAPLSFFLPVCSVDGSTTLIFPPRVLCWRQHHSPHPSYAPAFMDDLCSFSYRVEGTGLITLMETCRSLGILFRVRVECWGIQVLTAGSSQRLLSSSWRPDRLCGQPSFIFSKYIGSFCRSRAAGPCSRV
jgi:hypothetical protein